MIAGACLTLALTASNGTHQSGPLLAELKTIVVPPPPPPPPPVDSGTVDLRDKKGPLIPHIPSVVAVPQVHSWRVA
jgi:hypothetical protein